MLSPRGSSPWRTREAARSSRTGCPPPPLSCTSHSDWDPWRISEIISDTSVSPSLISAGIWTQRKESGPAGACVKGRRGADNSSDRCGASQLALAVYAPDYPCVSACSVPVKCHLTVFIASQEPMAAVGRRLVPPTSILMDLSSSMMAPPLGETTEQSRI